MYRVEATIYTILYSIYCIFFIGTFINILYYHIVYGK